MKFNELKEQIQLGVEVSELINFEFVSLMSQKIMVDNIKSICLKEDINGLLKVDYIFKRLFKLLYVVVNYTDIEIEDLYDEEYNLNSDLAFEVYDLFILNKLDEFIFSKTICIDFIVLLEEEINQEININNSVSFVLAKVLNNIAEKLPSENSMKSMMSDLPSLLSSFIQSTKKKTTAKKTQG